MLFWGSKLNVGVGRKTPQHFLIKGIKKLSKNLISRLIFSATKTIRLSRYKRQKGKDEGIIGDNAEEKSYRKKR